MKKIIYLFIGLFLIPNIRGMAPVKIDDQVFIGIGEIGAKIVKAEQLLSSTKADKQKAAELKIIFGGIRNQILKSFYDKFKEDVKGITVLPDLK